jgi:hypothetical protein
MISISLKARLEAHVIVVTLLLCVSLAFALSITVPMPIMVSKVKKVEDGPNFCALLRIFELYFACSQFALLLKLQN